MISKAQILEKIVTCFPEISQEIKYEQGLFYMQIGEFARFTQNVIDTKDQRTFLEICNLFVKLYNSASPTVENALNVAYLEHLNFQDSNRTERSWAYKLMPIIMRNAWHEINEHNNRVR